MQQVSALTRKLSGFTTFDKREQDALGALMDKPVQVAAQTELLQEGDRGSTAYIIVDGWGFCYKDLEDGGRQIINFQLPGDFLGLRSMLLRTSDHSFSTLTDCTLIELERARWEAIFSEFPRIGAAMLWAVARDEAIIVEHLVNLGRRSAHQRTAHLLCEFGHRLRALGLVTGNRFLCPISQTILSDALGLSVVHLNRTLRELRELDLVTVTSRGTEVTDFRSLLKFAGFDSEYLC